MQRKDYSNAFGISQSSLKEFRFKSPKAWKSIWIDRQSDVNKKDDNFVFGSLVDTLLFTPKELDNRFYIADVNKIPKGPTEKIIRNVFKKAYENKLFLETNKLILPETFEDSELKLADYKEDILANCISEDWQPRWKSETRVNKIIEEGSEYFNLLTQSGGKKIITSETNLEGIAVVNSLRSSNLVSKYFKPGETYNNIYQLELYYDYVDDETLQSVPLKAALDIVHVDYNNKTVQLVDFKTSYSAYDFLKSIKQYSYCDQLSFYNFILKEKLKEEQFRTEYSIPEDFKMLAPINIVIDKDESIPYVYQYNWDDITISKDGNAKFLFDLYQTQVHASKIKKGWLELVKDIAWHIQNNKWDYPREHYETGAIHVNLLNT